MVPMLREGDQVGDYELLERLGHGAMGVVFRARHVLIGREAAVKVLLPHLAAEESFRERFRREARTMAGIEHPSIVPIYEAREVDETTVYIAMKLLRGGTLGDRLARGPMPGDEVMRFATEIAAALDVLHDQGLVHRDVKPSTILFDDPGRAVLGDFGVTRDAQETALTRTDQVVGTIRYMSPERMLGQAPGPSADVYSLAAVIHEALRGEPLVAGESEGALVGALMTQDTPALGLEDADLSSRCDVVLAAALDKNPEARTTSASGLVQALVDAGLGASASQAPGDETQILGAPAGTREAVDDATTERADGGDATRTRIDPRGPRPAISASEAATEPPAKRRRVGLWTAAALVLLLIGVGGATVEGLVTGDGGGSVGGGGNDSQSVADATTVYETTQGPDPQVVRDNALRPAYIGRWQSFCAASDRLRRRENREIARPGLQQMPPIISKEVAFFKRARAYLLSSSVPSTERDTARQWARFFRVRAENYRKLLAAARAGDSALYNKVIVAGNRTRKRGLRRIDESIVDRVKHCRTGFSF